MTDFEVFWQAYPRRVAKANARKAFVKAIQLTTLETMLDAIERYKLHKPGYCDFKHPATWLNSEGWEDEWESTNDTLRIGLASAVVKGMEASGDSPGSHRGGTDGARTGTGNRPALFLVGPSQEAGGNADDVSDAGQLDSNGPGLFEGIK